MSRSQRGRLIVLALPFLGRPTSRPYVSAVARSAPRLAMSRLTIWRACSTGSGSRACAAAATARRPQRGRARAPADSRTSGRCHRRASVDGIAPAARRPDDPRQARPHASASASRPVRRLAAVERPADSLPPPSPARRRTSRMIETMTAMTNATMAIVRAFMGRLPGLQQRSRRPCSVSLALSPELPSCMWSRA
jgi:hypothetical protein